MPLNFIHRFLKMEIASGIILFLAALFALIWSNSFLHAWYQTIFSWTLIAKPISFWINEGFMTLFFLLIGLELKREFLEGKLNSVSNVILPAFAALGGMIVPAVIYVAINLSHPETLKGWAIPVATDIAFALGVLSLFGKKISLELRLFLMALAIFDDVGAILIIAFYHSGHLSYLSLLIAASLFLSLMLMNRLGARNLLFYGLLGVSLWFFILRSGIHPTLAGVLLALTIPLSSAKRLEQRLHPWSSFLIMPLFALANAGLSFAGLAFHDIVDYVALGIIMGLLFGKPLGVLSFTYFVTRCGWAILPRGASWRQVCGVAILCGIGFTMSLFLGNLAFGHETPHYQNQVRLGVLLGSALSGMLGAIFLLRTIRKGRQV